MKLKRNANLEGMRPKSEKGEIHAAKFGVITIRVIEIADTGMWSYVLYTGTHVIDRKEKYATKELAYSVAIAHSIELVGESLRGIQEEQKTIENNRFGTL